MDIAKTEQEINRVANWAYTGIDEGTRYPGMSYEQGLVDMLDWLTGDCDHAPDED